MTYLRIVLAIIAVSQLVLGILTLTAPIFFFTAMGLTAPPADTAYIVGMLAARFLVLGAVFALLLRRDHAEPLWLQSMVAIQVIDLAVGAYYTALGVIPLSVSAFPMFNAALLIALLTIGMRRRPRAGVMQRS